MSRLLLFNKPFHVLCQFTDREGRPTLADYIPVPDVYAAGRLDYDSEGLLLLTDNGRLQQLISDPQHKLPKTYWVQVERIPDQRALDRLRGGIKLSDGRARPAKVRLMAEPDVWDRDPPIRYRQHVPTAWLELIITEGRNRQVRRMTAAAGHPTLRLIRWAIGPWNLAGLARGAWRDAPFPEAWLQTGGTPG